MYAEVKLPDVLEIEVTTRCNFDCFMCLRRNWEHSDQDIPVAEFEKIAKNCFPHLKKLILLGQGEPLMHPQFLELLKISRVYLPKGAQIEFTSNGSLLSKEMLDKILPFNINRIVISLDSPFLEKLQTLRSGATNEIFDNLKHLSLERQTGKIGELAIATVLMASNLHDLETLIQFCADFPGIDSFFVSHILPYTEELRDEPCYETASLENKHLRVNVMEKWQDLLFQVFHNPVGWRQRVFSGDGWIHDMRSIITNTRNQGEDLDPTIMFRELFRSDFIQQVEKIYNTIQARSTEWKFRIDLPPIHPEKMKRKCPYIENNATIIRVDGNVAPCFNFLHSHDIFIHDQHRHEQGVSFGNAFNQPLSSIWNTKNYQNLRKRLSNMPQNIPWSGDCPYMPFDCFYMKNNSSDCYGNGPGCNICLYSTGQVKCIF